MKNQSAAEKNRVTSPIKTIGIAVACGMVLMLAVLAAGAAMLSGSDTSRSIMLPLALAAMAAGALGSGFLCGRLLRRSGMLYGLCCGSGLFFIAFLAEYFILGGSITALALYKFALYAVAGMIGGIAGVNRKSRVKKVKMHKK